MRRFMFCTAIAGILFTFAAPIQAQVNIRTKKDGDQRITTLEPVQPPAVIGKEFEGAKAKGTVLNANDWICGTQFTDEKNRQWRRVYGPALNTKPNVVSGWIIQTQQGSMYFMTESGTLYKLCRIVEPKAE